MFRTVSSTLALLACTSSSAGAGECISYAAGPQRVTNPEFDFCDAVSRDGLLYGVNENGLTIVDLASPASPVTVSTTDLGIDCGYVVLAGDFLWSADDAGVLRSIDVSNPSAPAVVGTLSQPFLARDIVADGDFVLVRGANQHWIYDASVASSPTFSGNIDNNSHITSLVARDGYAYMTTVEFEQVLWVYNVSPISFVAEVSFENTVLRTISGIAIDGDRLYVSSFEPESLGPCRYDAYTDRFDISNPAAPVLLSPIDVAGELAAANGTVVGAGHGRVAVFDPVSSTTTVVLGYSEVDWVTLDGSVAIADHFVIDLGTTPAPEPLGTLPNMDGRGVSVIHVDDFIYVLGADSDGCTAVNSRVFALDTDTPFGFLVDSSWDVSDNGYGRAMWAESDRLYVATGITEVSGHGVFSFRGEVLIYDTDSHPATEIGSYFTDFGAIADGASLGDHAYVLTRRLDAGTLHVLDVSDPAAVSEVAALDVGDANAVQLVKDVLYVGRSGEAGTEVFDLVDPALPSSVGTHAFPPTGLLLGSEMYTTGSPILRLDVSDPRSPSLLASAAGSGSDHAVVSGGALYASTARGVSVLDPITLERLDGALPARGPLTALGGDLFVYHDHEIRVYSPSCGSIVAVGSTPIAETIVRAAPNPFASTMTIRSEREGRTDVRIYDVAGRMVRRLSLEHGAATWDGSNTRGQTVEPGVYFYRVGEHSPVRRITRVR